MTKNITKFIIKENAERGNLIALKDELRSISYNQLFLDIDKCEKILQTNGIKKYDKISIQCKDSIEYVIISLAVLKLNASIIPVAINHTKNEVDEIINKIGVNFFIFDSVLYPNEYSSKNIFTEMDFKINFKISNISKSTTNTEFNDLDPAFIRFSSGTTGVSKGVILSHQSVIERTSAANKVLNVNSKDNIIWVLSMSFHFVVTILLFLRQGATTILAGGNIPSSFIDALKENDSTFLYATPFHYKLMISNNDINENVINNVRIAISTAMKLPPVVAEQFNEKFSFELSEAYGIIEVGLPFINYPAKKENRGSVGKCLPDYTIKIDSPNEKGIGNIILKGNGMFDAYCFPFKTRNELILDGSFDTGDVGHLDENGFLYIDGRFKNIINFNGMKIFPYEIENVILEFPAVKECRVYALQDSQYGEIPATEIVLTNNKKNNILADLRRFCYKKLATYKVPKKFSFVSELQKTISGKIDRG